MVHLFLVLMAILKKIITSNENCLTIAITDIIISEGLSFNIAQKPKFKKVLGLSRNVSNTYSSQKKYHIQKNTWCYSWRDHEKEPRTDKKGSRNIWVVNFRIWCYHFRVSSVEYSGFCKKTYRLLFWKMLIIKVV